MRNYYIWTIGCQMNKADSEHMGQLLEQLDYQPSPHPEAAELIILNSCVVRSSAENRVRGQLASLKRLKRARPETVIALTGCMVDSDLEVLKRQFPHVGLFFKPQAYEELWGFLTTEPYPNGHGALAGQSPVSAFVPIIRGCDNFCSYCIVPYRRGREQSRTPSEIVAEASHLAGMGAREITLLGQNVDSYGHDLPGKPDLAGLLAELNQVPGLYRLRFLTSHPKDMKAKLIETVARLDKVCEHINLPAQSGDDDILKAMRRGYTASDYRRLVAQIRNIIPGVALSTDIIVGFPGETEAQFRNTYDLLAELRFDTVHAAMYSPRPGTLASRTMPDDVPAAEKKRRLDMVEALQEQVAAGSNASLLGQGVEVLVEEQVKGKWQGRTRTNKLVFFAHEGDWHGQLVIVRVEKASPWSLQGKLIEVK